MASSKSLKRLARARQAETGESYMGALRHVMATVPTKHVAKPDGTYETRLARELTAEEAVAVLAARKDGAA